MAWVRVAMRMSSLHSYLVLIKCKINKCNIICSTCLSGILRLKQIKVEANKN